MPVPMTPVPSRAAGHVGVRRAALLRARPADCRRCRCFACGGHGGGRRYRAWMGGEVRDHPLRQWTRRRWVLPREQPAAGKLTRDEHGRTRSRLARVSAGRGYAPGGVVALHAGRPLGRAREERPARLEAVLHQERDDRRQLFLLLFRLQVVGQGTVARGDCSAFASGPRHTHSRS